MEELLPDRLKTAWRDVEAGVLSAEDFERRKDEWMAEYRAIWTAALLCDAQSDLQRSLLGEVAAYLRIDDLAEVERRCRAAVQAVADEWKDRVAPGEPGSVERYYDQSEGYIFDLTWWHTLAADDGPLAYVEALEFARRRGCRRVLDFGSGVGGGGILFARHGLAVTLADISSTLLGFTRWRFAQRGLPADFVDLKTTPLPAGAFDLVTAMDVFEHLTDPAAAIDDVWHALVPGGFFFARLHGEVDADHPQHIVEDFAPTFRRLAERGFVEVWRDEWVWGHQVFRRT